MTREELEIRINQAADGLLSDEELVKLEQELEAFPDLMEDYRSVLSLPDISGIYGSVEDHRNPSQIRAIREMLIEADEDSFSVAAIFWFRKVALAASLLILAASSLAGFVTGSFTDNSAANTVSVDELIYPSDQYPVEEYAGYLSDWPMQGEEGEMETNMTNTQ